MVPIGEPHKRCRNHPTDKVGLMFRKNHIATDVKARKKRHSLKFQGKGEIPNPKKEELKK